MVLELVDGTPGAFVYSDADGAFGFSVPEGRSLDLWYVAEGWAPGWRRRRIGSRADAFARRRLAGAPVELVSPGMFAGTTTPLVSTGPDGTARFDHVAAGSYSVWVSGGASVEVTVIEGATTETRVGS